MAQVNMLDAKTNLTKLIKNLETKIEDEYVICRNGKPCAVIIPFTEKNKKRVGCCEGKYPSISFEQWKNLDKEIEIDFDEWSNKKI